MGDAMTAKPLSKRIGKCCAGVNEATMFLVHGDVLEKWRDDAAAIEAQLAAMREAGNRLTECSDRDWIDDVAAWRKAAGGT
jgi:Cu/Ag efflux pump CusA